MKLIKKLDPRETDTLALGEDAYVDRLYGCFRFDNPKAGKFAAEREVELVFRSGRRIKVSVPESMKIELPVKGKVVGTGNFVIEPLGDNLDSMMLLTMRAGWNQTETDIRRIVGLDPSGTFVAALRSESYDIPVGTATVAPVGGRHTWIGMILVHPELRRQGIANSMMQHCVRHAIALGRIINGLDATPMGNTVYGAVGYVDSYRIWRCFFPPAERAGLPWDKNRVHRITDSGLEELIRYDTARFLERGNVLRSLFRDSEGEAWLQRNDIGEITGYVLARPGRIRHFVGPFVADDTPTAESLLNCVCQSLDSRGVKEAFIDTPESKFTNPGAYDRKVFDQEIKPSGHLLIKNLTPVRDFTRMYQAADERKAEELIENFMKVESLERTSPRVAEFEQTMRRSVANRTETLGFLEYENRVLQKYYWGITGPEKG